MVEKEESIKPIDFDWRNPYSASKLSKAVRSKNLSLVKKLIKSGCPLDAPDNRGWTPLHETAVSDEFVDIAQFLISADAYIEHKTVDDESPLMIACKNQAEKMVKLFIDAGCTVNTNNNERQTPLHLACSHRNENIIKLLLENGADINAKDFEERTPLYLALENVNTGALKILIEAGADLNSRDFFKRTPLQYSCMIGNLEMFNILINSLGREKSVIDQQTPEGWTLLMEAAQYKSYNIAEKLIEYGADTTLVDNRNLLALHIAAHCERYHLIELLLNNTPKSVIETYATLGKGMTHYRSLPCLIIDRNGFDSLKLLFQSGLSEEVLKCPVQMGNHILSPISFLILHANTVDRKDKLKYLEFLLKFDFLLDPLYKLDDSYRISHPMDANGIKIISPIEAALMVHVKSHRHCGCDKFLAMILARGVSPDKTPVNLIGRVHKFYLFGKALQLTYFSGLDLLIKYSDHIEAKDVLDMIIRSAMTELHIPTGDDKVMVAHIVKKLTHEVNSMHTQVTRTMKKEDFKNWKIGLIPIKDVLKRHLGVPPLKKLSRSVIRMHVREVIAKSPHIKMSVRQYLQNLNDLPYSITRYLTYDTDY